MKKHGNPTRLAACLTAALALTLGACSDERPPVKGFVLPEGDIEQGEATFVALGCPQCHTVVDTAIKQPAEPAYQVQLGGRFIRVKHYGDLLTSIVSPNHRVAPAYRAEAGAEEEPVSPMPDFTTAMSVEQLIDVVEFLNSKYTEIPRYSGRIYYYPP